jgi:hypothetical protein
MQTRIWQFLIMAIASTGVLVFAHEAHHKGHHPPPTAEEKSSLVQLNEKYLADVKPIFQKGCFDCHGPQSATPWYRNVPGAKQLIDHDLQESKEHLDMTADFPFKSHATPIEDLEAIQKSIDQDKMPPLRYKMMHSESSLTNEEKEKVRQWIQSGLEMLKEKSH